jgi:hypothetical protein
MNARSWRGWSSELGRTREAGARLAILLSAVLQSAPRAVDLLVSRGLLLADYLSEVRAVLSFVTLPAFGLVTSSAYMPCRQRSIGLPMRSRKAARDVTTWRRVMGDAA